MGGQTQNGRTHVPFSLSHYAVYPHHITKHHLHISGTEMAAAAHCSQEFCNFFDPAVECSRMLF